jgi:hypothetical protein
MSAATLDPGRLLKLYHRVARNGSIKLIFKNAAGEPVDISAIDFLVVVKRWLDDEDGLISLTIGSGLDVEGEDGNELVITITAEQATLSPLTYFWQLINNDSVKTWLNGDFVLHNGKFDAMSNDSTITINPEGNVIEITIADPVSISTIDGGNP